MKKTQEKTQEKTHEKTRHAPGFDLDLAGFQKSGAGERNRTVDLRITNALLYQLSYTGAAREYISGPAPAQGCHPT